MPKKESKPQTWDQMVASSLSSFQSLGAPISNVPEPTYKFEVGEKVAVGALKECEVFEIHEGGKLLLIRYRDYGHRYGNPYDEGLKPYWGWWFDVEPLKTIEETDFGRPRINASYTTSPIDSIVHQAYRRGLIDSPEYQRGYVWTDANRHNLIRSIFNRMDIGKFVLIDYPYPENRLEVVDGKQRLRCIMDFIEGRFAFEGKTYFQLSWQDKNCFWDNNIQVCTLDAKLVKKSDVLWLFLAINSGGVPQTPEHLTKAMEMYNQALAEGK